MTLQSINLRTVEAEYTSAALRRSLALAPSNLDLSQLTDVLDKADREVSDLRDIFRCNHEIAGGLTNRLRYQEIAQVQCGRSPINSICKVGEGGYVVMDSNGVLSGIRMVGSKWEKNAESQAFRGFSGNLRLLDRSSFLLVSDRDSPPTLVHFSFDGEFKVLSMRPVAELSEQRSIRLSIHKSLVGASSSGKISIFEFKQEADNWSLKYAFDNPGFSCANLTTLPGTYLCAVLSSSDRTIVREWSQTGYNAASTDIEVEHEHSAIHVACSGDIWQGFENGSITSLNQSKRQLIGVVLPSRITLIRSLNSEAIFAADDKGQMRVVFLGATSNVSNTPVFGVRRHEVRDVQFTPTGEIVTAGSDGYLRIWG